MKNIKNYLEDFMEMKKNIIEMERELEQKQTTLKLLQNSINSFFELEEVSEEEIEALIRDYQLFLWDWERKK